MWRHSTSIPLEPQYVTIRSQSSCPIHTGPETADAKKTSTSKPKLQDKNPVQADDPLVPGLPILGSLIDFKTRGLLSVFLQGWKNHGDCFKVVVPTKEFYVVAHPEYVKHVLITNRNKYCKGSSTTKDMELVLGTGLSTAEGPQWQFARRLIQPIFTQKRLGNFAACTVQETDISMSEWKSREADGKTRLDLKTEMLKLTMAIIGRVMLSTDMRKDAEELNKALVYAFDYIGDRLTNPLLPPVSWPTPANLKFKLAQQTINSFVYNVIDQRLDGTDTISDDFLTLLLAARDEDSGQGLSREQVRDEVITMVGGGYETSATLLTWMIYALARYPDVTRRVYDEICEVVGGPNEPITIDHVPKLSYTNLVLMEAMRLFPTIWVFLREAVEDDMIGNVKVNKGATVLISTYLTHRHPQFWDNPEAFDPSRFERPISHQYAYIPFGAGARSCIGTSVAQLEMMLIVAKLVQRYRLELAPGQAVVDFDALTMLQPSIPISIDAIPRLK